VFLTGWFGNGRVKNHVLLQHTELRSLGRLRSQEQKFFGKYVLLANAIFFAGWCYMIPAGRQQEEDGITFRMMIIVRFTVRNKKQPPIFLLAVFLQGKFVKHLQQFPNKHLPIKLYWDVPIPLY